MTTPTTDEALAEIKAGLEGVTPGPWRTPGAKVPWVIRVGGDDYGSVQVAECGDYRDKEISPYNMPRWLADAAHIARMDPATVARMIARIEAAEARVKALEGELAGQRMCVNCGKFAPLGHRKEDPLPGCVDDQGYAACTQVGAINQTIRVDIPTFSGSLVVNEGRICHPKNGDSQSWHNSTSVMSVNLPKFWTLPLA